MRRVPGAIEERSAPEYENAKYLGEGGEGRRVAALYSHEQYRPICVVGLWFAFITDCFLQVKQKVSLRTGSETF